MNAENFAEWLRLQGYKVVRTENSYWYDASQRVYQAFPYHWLINPTSNELSEILLRNKGLGLRYSTPIHECTGAVSYHAVLEEMDYGMESLGKWARKNVRRGLNNCSVEPISFNRLAEEGWSLQIDTLTRQGRNPVITPEGWRTICNSASSLPGFTAWGALVTNHLAASVITFEMDNWAYMLYQQCNHEYLAEHVNNALTFIVTDHLLQKSNVTSILYALHSLDAPPSVDEFKFRMGYKAKPVRQRVVFNPGLSFLFNPLSHKLIKSILHAFPGNPKLAKAEGMMRFYIEGKKPLNKQVWPEILVEQREAILSTLRK
jgi:hypothetical protein